MGGNGFSSLKNFDTLKEAGFNENQARAILEMMNQDSASKQDLEHATADLKRDIAEIKRDIKKLEERLDERFERVDERFERVDERFKRFEERLDERFRNFGHKMIIASGSFAFAILSALVTLAKLGLLTPLK